MSAKPTFLNFAYGSNMLMRRLCERAPSARPVDVARLPGYALRWHKVGQDGSGKCDIVPVEVPGAKVLGVVYEILMCEKGALDAAEGLGKGYDEKQVRVDTAAGELQAQLYVATTVDSAAIPYDWYKALVVAGAKEHGLEAAYVSQLEATVAQVDANAQRGSANFALANRG